MKCNAILRRKHFFEPVAVVLDIEFPDDIPEEEQDRLATIELVAKAGLYIELERHDEIERGAGRPRKT